jgi:hypothetical protein
MSGVIKIVKSGGDISSTDPNDFIFHSDYNTLKILDTDLYEPTILANTPNGTEFTVAHGQDTAPMVMAFLREATDDKVIFCNNKGNWLFFLAVKTDETNIIFKISNSHLTNNIVAHIRYYIFEIPL